MKSPQSLFPTDVDMALDTDLYQLTMAAAYFHHDLNHRSSFELFVRHMPPNWGYLLAAGLEQALHYLSGLRFSDAGIAHLRGLPVFKDVPAAFFDYLQDFRFSGEVWALPEGTPVFPHEPILQVTAPAIEAQLVETFLLTSINYQTLIASKAARVVHAAAGRRVVEFGTRRAHGPQAGLLAARASFIGGCDGTSNVLAGQRLGIPVYGTMAHSWVMAFHQEQEAFRKYYELFPDSTILLIDTYDTVEGARRAVAMGQKEIRGVRLDSGDFLALSREVRRVLDEGGLDKAMIFLSGDLNEDKIAALLQAGAPLDAFGVGTELVTCRDYPALGGVYKLVEVEIKGERIPKIKLSPDKATYPGRKQVFRLQNGGGSFRQDILGLVEEDGPAGAEALLQPVMRAGRVVVELPGVEAIRQRALEQVGRLPEEVRSLQSPAPYPVRRSPALEELFGQAVAAANSRLPVSG